MRQQRYEVVIEHGCSENEWNAMMCYSSQW